MNGKMIVVLELKRRGYKVNQAHSVQLYSWITDVCTLKNTFIVPFHSNLNKLAVRIINFNLIFIEFILKL